MSDSFITPIKLMNSIGDMNPTAQVAAKDGTSAFTDIFKNAVSDAVSKDKELTNQQYLLSTGQINDAHTVPIAAAEAQLSIDLLVQLRNKALESYNELIRMSV